MSSFAAVVDRRRDRLEPRAIARLEHALLGSGTLETTRGSSWAAAATGSSAGRQARTGEDSNGFCLGADGLQLRAIVQSPALEALGAEAGVIAIGHNLAQPMTRSGASLWQSLPGPFAIALLEPFEWALHLARDPLGARTLFFAESGSLVWLADRLEVLLRCQARSLEASQLVRYFGLDSPRAGKTFFQGVEEVEPGTVVRFSSEGRATERFWTPEPDKARAARSDAAFVEDFRTELERATASLLSDPAQLGIMLSGGLDSTSLAVAAARQAQRQGGRVAACSWLFDELGACDERDRIACTLALHDFEVIQISGDDCWPLADLDLFSNLPGTPEENPFRALKSALYSAARERGRTLLFNGGTAEIFFRGGNLYFRDLLRDHRWGDAVRGLTRQVRRSGWRSAAGSVARVLRPAGRRRGHRPAPNWLTEQAKRWWSKEYAAPASLERGTRDVVPYLAMESRGFAIENLYAEQQGVRVASPYWTRGWMDFMLSLPAHQAYRPGVNKYIAREAMRGAIPESVRTRQSPTLLDPLFCRGLFEREKQVVEDLLYAKNAVWHDFVNPEVVAGLGPDSPSSLQLVLWNCVGFELWRRKHGWEVG